MILYIHFNQNNFILNQINLKKYIILIMMRLHLYLAINQEIINHFLNNFIRLLYQYLKNHVFQLMINEQHGFFKNLLLFLLFLLCTIFLIINLKKLLN